MSAIDSAPTQGAAPEVLDFDCPSCRAEPGISCISRMSMTVANGHASRRHRQAKALVLWRAGEQVNYGLDGPELHPERWVVSAELEREMVHIRALRGRREAFRRRERRRQAGLD